MSRFILGVTGASGSLYALRLALYLKKYGHKIALIVSHPGQEVIKFEGCEELFNFADEVFEVDDFYKEPASGSSNYMGMAIVPCSMGTLGRIASGTSDNLLVRSADVCLKEHKPLVIVPREMPYNLIHLENMEKLCRASATIISASPQFYSKPKTIEDLVDTVVVKILRHLKAIDFTEEKEIIKPWSGHF